MTVHIPNEYEGTRVVLTGEAMFAFGTLSVDLMGALTDMAKARGWTDMALGVQQALKCWCWTDKAGSESIAAEIKARAEAKYTDPLERWFHGTDTGTSSLTIAHVLGGTPAPRTGFSHPYDPDDLGRCLRLVRLMGWRDRLPEVAARFPRSPWPRLVDAWDELAALYDLESPRHRAPKCYARMQAINRPPKSTP
jgi:hypothetical protein